MNDPLLHHFISSNFKSQKLINMGCEPKWINAVGRSSFYIDCLDKFDINGFFSRSSFIIRKLNDIGHDIRKLITKNVAGGAQEQGFGFSKYLLFIIWPILRDLGWILV